MFQSLRIFFLLIIATAAAALIAMPDEVPIHFNGFGRQIEYTLKRPQPNFPIFGRQFAPDWSLKEGLDIQGGMQVTLRADMKDIPEADRATALNSAKEVIQRRVDMFGVSEPIVQTAQSGEDSRIVVELAGVSDADQALRLVGRTAQLDFRLQNASAAAAASGSALALYQSFEPTGLTGKQLKRSSVEFDQQTGEPVVTMEFNEEGRDLFAKITQNNIGQILAIFLDDAPVTLPRINSAILDGRANITGQFALEDAKQLSIQLNAGALPVPIEVIEQRSIGASLGQRSIEKSVQAGVIGIIFVAAFMIMYYGWRGVLADLALIMYAIFTVATYKILGITLSLPGIAGLLLTIGMAVDANILIFERMKEEQRAGRPFGQAMELGFQRAWQSIKDANLTTIFVALILINPFDFSFLNRSGLVKGFGLTLLIGVVLSLFTSTIATKTLMRLFLKGKDND